MNDRLNERQSLLNRIMNPKYIMVYATVIIFLIIYTYGAIRYGSIGFTTLRTFVNFFADNAYYGISAVGMTMVLITGGIDLSVASVASLTGMIIAYGYERMGISPVVTMLFSVLVGVGLGALMGAAIHYLNVPPFITTLTGNFLARGVCSLISRESISINHPLIDALAGFKIYLYHRVDGEWVKIKPVTSINLTVILFLVMIVLGTILLQHTRFGRNVYAVGGSESSARLMGLPVGKTKIAVYAINGFCSALAGIAYVLIVKSGWNMSLQGGELEVISSAVIGGTLLTGGVGYMIGTMFGVLLKSVIPAIINFNGTLSSWWGKIATGALLLLFIVIQRAVVSYSGRRKK
ncbi:MAG: sugar ABC transporter permease YjfF [Clostridiales bacterium]|nr:sugar ABC transporter permease YjfF [Clostridiales bacterium]